MIAPTSSGVTAADSSEVARWSRAMRSVSRRCASYSRRPVERERALLRHRLDERALLRLEGARLGEADPDRPPPRNPARAAPPPRRNRPPGPRAPPPPDSATRFGGGPQPHGLAGAECVGLRHGGAWADRLEPEQESLGEADRPDELEHARLALQEQGHRAGADERERALEHDRGDVLARRRRGERDAERMELLEALRMRIGRRRLCAVGDHGAETLYPNPRVAICPDRA